MINLSTETPGFMPDNTTGSSEMKRERRALPIRFSHKLTPEVVPPKLGHPFEALEVLRVLPRTSLC